MDSAKFDYFIAKYRAMAAADLQEAGLGADDLADEAGAALKQVALERGISIAPRMPRTEPQSPSDLRKARLEAEETSYSPARAEEILHRALGSAAGLVACNVLGFAIYSGLTPAPAVAIVAGLMLLVSVWTLYCIYKLSRSIDPSRTLAWTMVAIQFLPLIGLLAAVSAIRKGLRIRRSVLANSPSPGMQS